MRKMLCWLGIHKSDSNYQLKGIGGGVISHCKHCDKVIKHKKTR